MRATLTFLAVLLILGGLQGLTALVFVLLMIGGTKKAAEAESGIRK